LKIVRLFQKLNQGGTVLSGLELMRSVLKAYSVENETFLNRVKDTYQDIGFDQDEIIKLIFLFQDNARKDITDIDDKDSAFINEKGQRLMLSLDATRDFLKHAGLYDYFKAVRPSIIPLTFIAYHLFHSATSDDQLRGYFDNSETGNTNFHPMRKWLMLSYLNNVFKRGNGWVPDKTGKFKLLDKIKEYKSTAFPTEELFATYEAHSLHIFDRQLKDNWERLNWYDRRLVIYLLYGKPDTFRQNDIDHIHPKSILAEKGIDWSEINNLGNYQYLYYSDNRSKQDTEFGAWLKSALTNDVAKINHFIQMHSIPADEALWYSDRYTDFLEERRKLIYQKLMDALA